MNTETINKWSRIHVREIPGNRLILSIAGRVRKHLSSISCSCCKSAHSLEVSLRCQSGVNVLQGAGQGTSSLSLYGFPQHLRGTECVLWFPQSFPQPSMMFDSLFNPPTWYSKQILTGGKTTAEPPYRYSCFRFFYGFNNNFLFKPFKIHCHSYFITVSVYGTFELICECARHKDA